MKLFSVLQANRRTFRLSSRTANLEDKDEKWFSSFEQGEEEGGRRRKEANDLRSTISFFFQGNKSLSKGTSFPAHSFTMPACVQHQKMVSFFSSLFLELLDDPSLLCCACSHHVRSALVQISFLLLFLLLLLLLQRSNFNQKTVLLPPPPPASPA